MSEQNDQSQTNAGSDPTPDDPGFDELLDKLESIVVQLEKGELPLDETLDRFEAGMALATKASSVLEKAEMRVDKLIRERGQLVAVPLEDRS